MRLLGYARGNPASQFEALLSAGVDPDAVFTDVASGTNEAPDRHGLGRLLQHAQEGDSVIVWRIDRLGRSLTEVLDTVVMLGKLGLNIRSLLDEIDPSTTNGRLMMNLLASLAEYERHLNGERIAAGMKAAGQAGTRLGRPPVDPTVIRDKIREVEDARARGMTAAHAAQLVGWSRATFYRHQQEHRSQR